jgi:hypothetical protein
MVYAAEISHLRANAASKLPPRFLTLFGADARQLPTYFSYRVFKNGCRRNSSEGEQ